MHEAKRRETELGIKSSVPQTSPAKLLTTQRQPQLGIQQQQQRIILPQHPLPQQILMQQVASPMTSSQHSTNQHLVDKQQVMTSYASTNQGSVLINSPMTSQLVSTNERQQYIIASTQSPIYTVSTSQANSKQELIFATASNNELIHQQTSFETSQHGGEDINVSVAQMISQGQLNPRSQQAIIQHDHQIPISSAQNVSSDSSPLGGLVQIEVPLPLPEEALANEVAFEAEDVIDEDHDASNLQFVDDNVRIDPNTVYSTANLQDETTIEQEQNIHLPFPQSLSEMQSSVHFEPSHHESFEPPEQLLDEDMDDNIEQETFLPNDGASNINNVEMYASENETGDLNDSLEDTTEEDFHSNDESEREMKSKESAPTPTRSTLPGMIVPSGLMSLSSAANIFRAESISSKSSSRLVFLNYINI